MSKGWMIAGGVLLGLLLLIGGALFGIVLRWGAGFPMHWGSAFIGSAPRGTGLWFGGHGGMMRGAQWPLCASDYGERTDQSGERLSLDQAMEVAEDYVAGAGGGLEVAEVMEFDNHFYAEAREIASGMGAFEFLIDPYTEAVQPEPGPNMMWNTKYGMMAGGMMRGGQAAAGGMAVSAEDARQLAQESLNAISPDLQVGDDVDEFYGYYTIHVLHDGAIIGMLSVNGYSGEVWYHTWHGTFIGMTEHGDAE
jgi:hypothetical protein